VNAPDNAASIDDWRTVDDSNDNCEKDKEWGQDKDQERTPNDINGTLEKLLKMVVGRHINQRTDVSVVTGAR
jgi:hypothetical protein